MERDAQRGHDDAAHPVEQRTVVAAAEDLEVGNLVELATQFGPSVIRIVQIERRVHGIKLTGLSAEGGKWSFGAKYGERMTCIDEA
jgi:hypothetical protein